jgi:hypothetical protein
MKRFFCLAVTLIIALALCLGVSASETECTHANVRYDHEQKDDSVHLVITVCEDCGSRVAEVDEKHVMIVDECGWCGFIVPQEGEEDVTPPPADNEILEEAKTHSEEIVAWIMENIEEISVICTMILTTILTIRKLAILIKSAITMNNNTVTVASNSEKVVQEASTTVGNYVDAMNELLAEVRSNADEKQKLVAKLDDATRFMNTAKLANMELANEVAELLVLANIPNSKKEELYSRHRAAVNAIAAAEETEVKADVADEEEA